MIGTAGFLWRGFGRALIRVVVPILCVEGVRMPLMLALISEAEWPGLQTALYVIAAVVCGWIPALLALRARRENGFATAWDLASGERVLSAEGHEDFARDLVFSPDGTTLAYLAMRTGNPHYLAMLEQAEQAGHARQCAGFIFDQDGDNVTHQAAPLFLFSGDMCISWCPLPASIIG